MNDITLSAASPESPFDAIKKTTPDGDRWSARDLMTASGYDSWRRFEDAIDRAKITCKNSEVDPDHHFAASDKVIEGGRWGTHTVTDYQLTRYAAYLVAMNGDPRKPEIAAAQTYFAVKTREAETRPAQYAIPTDYASALRLAAAKVEEAEAERAGRLVAEQQRDQLAPHAESYRAIVDASGDFDARSAAQILSRDRRTVIGQKQLMDLMREQNWIDKSSRRPYQYQVRLGRLVAREYPWTDDEGNRHVRYQPRITPKGLDKLREILLARHAGTELTVIDGGDGAA